MCFNFLFFYFFISYFLFLSLHQHRGKETREEDDRGAKDDGKVGMQMDAWKVPDGSKGYPGDEMEARDIQAMTKMPATQPRKAAKRLIF